MNQQEATRLARHIPREMPGIQVEIRRRGATSWWIQATNVQTRQILSVKSRLDWESVKWAWAPREQVFEGLPALSEVL